jgi:hypothetical protein
MDQKLNTALFVALPCGKLVNAVRERSHMQGRGTKPFQNFGPLIFKSLPLFVGRDKSCENLDVLVTTLIKKDSVLGHRLASF